MRTKGALLVALAAVTTALAQPEMAIDFDDVTGWTPEPGWQPNPAGKPVARVEGGVGEFRVDEAHKGMKWRTGVEPFNPMSAGYFVMRYRAANLVPSEDYLIWVFDAASGGHTLLPRSAVRDDAQWHTLAIDLWAVGVTGNVTGLALNVQAAEKTPASLWIDYLRYAEEPPTEAERYPKEGLNEMTWQEDFDKADEWQNHPDWLANPDLSATTANDGGAVLITVPTAGKGMKWSKRFEQGPDLKDARYVSIRYRAENIAPHGDYFVWLGSETGGMPQEYETLLPLSSVEDDGRWHVYIGPLTKHFKVAEMAIQAQADASPGRAWIDYVRFTSRRPLVPISDQLPYAKGFSGLRLKEGRFVTVDISVAGNAKSAMLRKALGLSDWFTGEPVTAQVPRSTSPTSRITVEGIPFALASGERDVVATPKGKAEPVAVSVNHAAREVYLLMASILPAGDLSGMLGQRPLLKFSDPERFVARVRYADGVEDLQFPVRVRSGQYEVAGGVDVYCLPELRAAPVRNLALECRMSSGRMVLAGLTLNTGKPLVKRPFVSVLPPPVKERPLPRVVTGFHDSLEPATVERHHAPRRPNVAVTADTVVITTSTLTAMFRLGVGTADGAREGVTLVSLQNHCLYGGSTRFSNGSFFELGVQGGKVLTSDKVKVTNLRCEGNTVTMAADARPEVPIAGQLRLTATGTGEILMSLNVRNMADQILLPIVIFPSFSRVVLGDVENTWYFYARQGGIINNVPTRQDAAYSGRYPLQVTGLFNPKLGGGMYLLARDMNDLYKYYFTDKNAEGVFWRIEYLPREYEPGEAIETAETALCGNTGDWRAQLAAYQRWVKTWYKPIVPRKNWFRDVYNYRQHYVRSDLYDFKTKTYHIREVADKDREFFGLSDYLHIFDFGQSDTYGRVGDYSHYDEIGGREKLAMAIADTEKAGVPVGLYIEGYLCDERGLWGREHVDDCHIIRKDGKPLLWGDAPPEHMMCPANATWQEHLSSTYRRVAAELKPMGMYIDQHGFGDAGKICWSRKHGHPVPWPPLRGERELGRKIREAVPAEIATLTEETPTDVNSQVQDGALGYSVAFNDPYLSPHRVDLFRFAFPDFKVFQLVAYNDFIDGGWGLLKFPFFNAEGWWLGNEIPRGFEAAAQQFLRKAFAILHAHAEAFRSDNPHPLVPTLNPLVYANAFPTKKETVWTLFNADYRTHRGPVLEVEHVKGATYRDAWNGVDLKPVIKGRRALLRVTLGPREVGCVVQRGEGS